jgi:hypothetical protein
MYNYIPGSVMDNVVTVNSLCSTIDGTQQLGNDSIYHSEKVKNLDMKHTIVFIVIVSTYNYECLKTNLHMIFRNNMLGEVIYKKSSNRLSMLGAKRQLLMLFTCPGGGGKSYVIYAVLQYCKAFGLGAGVTFVSNSFLVSACSNSAAFFISGNTIHVMCHFNSKKSCLQGQGQGCQWRTVKFIIIDLVSSFTCNELQKLDKQLWYLTGNWTMLFGGVHVIYVGYYFQVDPVSGIPLYGPDYATHCKHAINARVYHDGSHRSKDDSKWGEIMSRLRLGHTMWEDIYTINSLVLGKELSYHVTQMLYSMHAALTSRNT